MTDYVLTPRSPFTDLSHPAAPGGGGVAAVDRSALAIARLCVRKGRRADLTQRIRDRFGIGLPRGPQVAEAGLARFIGVGVGIWLVLTEHHPQSQSEDCGGTQLTALLVEVAGDCAAVSDQSGAYGVLRLTGPQVRSALAKLLPIDLHERRFRIGNAASTLASHMPVTIWRLEDSPDRCAVFEIATPRSLAASFWHALAQSAAEYGFA